MSENEKSGREDFQPLPHVAPTGIVNNLLFNVRRIVDFSVFTVLFHLSVFLRECDGKILDIGCGDSPYQHIILGHNLDYVGMDIYNSEEFKYKDKKNIHYDGTNFPFAAESFENIICTEVLEHCQKPEIVVQEMLRVLKPGVARLLLFLGLPAITILNMIIFVIPLWLCASCLKTLAK